MLVGPPSSRADGGVATLVAAWQTFCLDQRPGSLTAHFTPAHVCKGYTLCFSVALDLARPLPAQLTEILAAFLPPRHGEPHLTLRCDENGVPVPICDVRCYVGLT